MTEIIMQMYPVIEEIKHENQLNQLRLLKNQIEVEYKDLLFEFNQVKLSYERIMEAGGMHHPNYQKYAKKLSEIKKTLYEKDIVQTYIELEQKLQESLNQFLNQIAKTISTHITTPNPYGIIKKKGNPHVHQ